MSQITPESASGDGYVTLSLDGGVWGNVHNATSGTADSGATTIYLNAEGEPYGQYPTIARGFVAFDTSAIGTGSTITSGSLAVYVTEINGDGTNHYIGYANQASTSSLSGSDFDNVTVHSPTAYATSIPINGSTGTKTWTLNSDGLNAIVKDGYTKMCIRARVDWQDDDAAEWVSPVIASSSHGSYAGPTLTVDYTSGGTNATISTSASGVTVTGNTSTISATATISTVSYEVSAGYNLSLLVGSATINCNAPPSGYEVVGCQSDVSASTLADPYNVVAAQSGSNDIYVSWQHDTADTFDVQVSVNGGAWVTV